MHPMTTSIFVQRFKDPIHLRFLTRILRLPHHTLHPISALEVVSFEFKIIKRLSFLVNPFDVN